jgi:tripartite-type tricarboxylate transporter receptor subunit TctC
MPDMKQRLANEGAEPIASTPGDFAAFVKAEINKWSEVGRAAKIQPAD